MMKMVIVHIYTLVLFLLTLLPSTATAQQLSQQEYSILHKVYTCIEQGEFEAGLAQLHVLLKRKRPSSYTFSYAALCYSNMGEEAKAIDVLKRAVTIFPQQTGLWQNLGILQMQIGDYDRAIDSFTTLLSLQDKEDPSIRYNLAFAFYRQENFHQALSTVQPLTKNNLCKRHWLLLQIYCEMGLKNWATAETDGLRLLALSPNSSSVWSLLGNIALNRENHSGATAYLEIANILTQENTASNTIANLYGAQSAWNELIRYQHIINKPTIDIVENMLRSCQYKRALTEVETIPETAESMTEAFLKGQILFSLGKNKAAVQELLRVEKLPFTLGMGDAKSKKKNKTIRRKRNRLIARTLLLAGQILWLDHRWLEARDVFKRLELQSGHETLGKNLARCMQSLLLEKKTPIEQPGLYSPPLT